MSSYSWSIEWARSARIRTLAKLQTTSTNADAKEQISILGHRSLVVADHQTNGRGRGDHVWLDSSGQALLSSWIFELDKNPQPILSPLVGLALFEAAKRTWPEISWALRAPNDLHVIEKTTGSAKKIAGLFIEVISGGAPSKTHVIVGLGMNISGAPASTTPFPATFLASELASRSLPLNETEWSRFLETWISGCEARVKAGSASELKQSSRTALRAALAEHPEFRDIAEVLADGSFLFKDGRTVRWTEL
jgi:biotin-(acetyl-CoA carboxylase) ligase